MKKQPTQTELLSALQKSAMVIQKQKKELARYSEPIAVIGMDCRFPGADSPEAFWELLRSGADMVTSVPAGRFAVDEYYDPIPGTLGKTYVREGAFLQQIDSFDAPFFGISPREAVNMDPQHRLLLEVSYSALERAGQAPSGLKNSKTGVFVGVSSSEYAMRMDEISRSDAYVSTGNLEIFASGRLSYLLGLQGPNLVIDTACSASLIGVHLACESLRNRSSDLALAGGVHLMLSVQGHVKMSQLRALAPDGRCKTFDAAANGFGRGEGCGIVVLKRLSDALADHDDILALIRGTAINHDGPSSGLTVPSVTAQAALIRQALENAQVAAKDVGYVDVHGTGTTLGDPIEIRALSTVFDKRSSPLLVGSVKTNIGHLEEAAGVASLLKVILAMQHDEIPPHLHLQHPNPHIDWDQIAIRVPTDPTPWPAGLRVAGVSSFGMGGSNAHVVLQEAPAQELAKADIERPLHLLTLSAKTQPALHELVAKYETYLATESAERCPEPVEELADICFTANTGRSHFKYRYAAVAADKAQMMDQLARKARQSSLDKSRSGPPETTEVVTTSTSPQVAFLFTGQGSQYAGMGRELYETEPLFRQIVEQCDEILRSWMGESLIEILFGEDAPIDQTAYTQVALLALEYALAKLWESWGVVPDVVMGHSVGELVAACVAGVFTLEDGLKLVAARGRLIQSTEAGQMVAIFASEADVKSALDGASSQGCAIAAINGPELTVIAGTAHACRAIVSHFESAGVRCQPLTVSHAFHSPLMEPILEPFSEVAKQITFAAPRMALISNLTGEIVTDDVTTPEYWVRHIRQAVRFADGMQTLAQMGIDTFIEIGPKANLLGMGQRALSPEADGTSSNSMSYLPSLRPKHEWGTLLASVGQVYVRGVTIDWASFYKTPHRKALIPTYPFQRERYWFDASPAHSIRSHPTLHPLVHRRVPTPKQIIFESQLSTNQPAYLADHTLSAHAILPASAYLEMVLAAASRLYGSERLSLSDVLWEQPLNLPNDQAQTVQLTLSPAAEGYTFELFSLAHHNDFPGSDSGPVTADEEWLAHASGKVSHHLLTSVSVDLPSLKARYPQEVPIRAYYRKIAAIGMHYGPSFQAIEQLFLSSAPEQTEVLARVCVPEAISTQGYHIHPVLLDASFQVAFALIKEDQELFLPFALSALHLYAQPDTTLWVAAKRSPSTGSGTGGADGTLTVELELFHEDGTKVADVQGLTLRASEIRTTNWERWLYQLHWQPKAAPTPSPKVGGGAGGGGWLIFADRGGIGEQLAQKLTERGEHCLLVFAGASYQQVNKDCYEVDPLVPADFERLVETLGEPIFGIVHLWSLETQEGDHLTGCGSVLHLVQALIGVQQESPLAPRLWLVTRGAQAGSKVGEGIWQAPLWGLGRVIREEHPQFQCVCLDLVPEATFAVPLADLVFHDLWQPDDSDDEIIFRDGERYVAQLRPAKLAVKQPRLIDGTGCYLITGGLGALGRQVADFLVEQGARHLLLTGRGGAASPEAQTVVKQLEEKGANVAVVEADIAKPDDVERVLKAASAPLHGVIHAAGVLDDGVLMQQSLRRFEKVMAPKVQGAWNLHQQTLNQPLDFFVLFSSAASLLGSAGQANYAAANAFMDGLAHYRHTLGLPALSINWGPFGSAQDQPWTEGGMAQEAEERLIRAGWEMITPVIGSDILEMLLKTDAAQVGVLPIDWKRWQKSTVSKFGAPRPKASKSEIIALKQIQSAVNPQAMLQAHIRAQIAEVLLMNPQQIEPHQRLFDLGLDSLMALELKKNLESSLGCVLHSTLLFDYPTPEALENYLSQKVHINPEMNAEMDESTASSEANTQALLSDSLSAFDQLSKHDLYTLLNEKVTLLESELEGSKSHDQ